MQVIIAKRVALLAALGTQSEYDIAISLSSYASLAYLLEVGMGTLY